MSKKISHKAALNDIIDRNRQPLIIAINTLEEILNCRTLEGAKKKAQKALKKSGYWPDEGK